MRGDFGYALNVARVELDLDLAGRRDGEAFVGAGVVEPARGRLFLGDGPRAPALTEVVAPAALVASTHADSERQDQSSSGQRTDTSDARGTTQSPSQHIPRESESML